MKTTIKEFAEANGVDTGIAGGFLRFLEAKGMARIVEQRKSDSGKGKPSGVYEVSDEIITAVSTGTKVVA